ncbi:Response regulator of zinc sigma-54-dependent two-component system [hydrothermal vent metagenome]|uniref:Response regulator of zinc sigma-54-dependent two-component system n=1 Tax=hydrothermal vent metagenome TaxID=652676 RepID=A0A3B0ZMD8_9ZZZZ
MTAHLNKISTSALTALEQLFSRAAIFQVDKERKIIYWNKQAEALLGFSASELLGQSCISGNRCKQCMTGCNLSEKLSIEGSPISLHHKSGAQVHFRKYAHAFLDKQGCFNGGIEILLPEQASSHAAVITGTTRDARYFHGIVSRDPAMQEIFKIVRNVAETDVNVLARGESGTGKELIAQAIHDESSRRDKPFVAINCASLSANLLESELFGHIKGAFTDAVRDHVGIIQRAEGGTLFFDEIAELPISLQAKLLRVLQERVFSPLGSEKVVKANIRILAATHQSLRKLVKEGKFREDLMYRLRVVPLFIPPLRERKGDIKLLLDYFIEELSKTSNRCITEIEPDAMRLLLNYDWPGNIRELRNVVEYANAVSREQVLTINDLPPEFFEEQSIRQMSRKDFKLENEKQKLKQALLECDGNLDLTAEVLDISRTTLWRKRKKYDL